MGSRGRRKQRWCTDESHHHQPLTPLMEGPDDLEMQLRPDRNKKESSGGWDTIRDWFRLQKKCAIMPASDHHHPSSDSSSTSSNNNSSSNSRQDMRLLLGVLACPLAPIPLPHYQTDNNHHQLPPPINKHIPIETCTAHYIIQQYLAATGWSTSKKVKEVKNMYAAGTVNMVYRQTEVSSLEDGEVVNKTVGRSGGGSGGDGEKGCFVVWAMWPGRWSLELVVGGNKVVAGSDSKIVWRHTPWLGTHAAKGPLRPLRRIIQGLDPKSTASLFTGKAAQCMGEKRIGEEDCFVIKVAADRASVMERNDGPAGAEVIRHVLYGYFSQRSGLLIYLEDSHLTRVLVNPQEAINVDHRNYDPYADDLAPAVYWETTIGSSIGDYRDVDGVLIAHRGRTVATVFRFGETSSQQYWRTTMEELWTIHDVVFDVPGLSVDSFIPPADIWDSHPS
ncbi:OLC1v1022190C1 [Oldenlandia corymbosa var. corymbosa]|uniref:OLC1v1022190C1 n=1 Tax=Oldenlandia corymbosa var. corymbosa TaxID=529605 RepID=A0AAV1BXA2_OLDCO|nr:OLC1v1022190C1 [Oldenlandia corymbosa var. corymbosa]